MKESSNSTRNIKHVNFVPKDVERILSSHKSIMNRKCSTRRLFLKILQYSQKNTFLNKNAGLQALCFIKKRLEDRCFLRTLRNFHLIRGSRPEVFREKGVLRSFTKFTGRYLRSATLLKKRLWRRCFLVNFAKFLRTTFFTEHLRWLLLPIFKYICVRLLLTRSSLELFAHKTFSQK